MTGMDHGNDAAAPYLNPDHWLIFGRAWPADAGNVAECATAIAPQTTDRRIFSQHGQGILDASAAFAQTHNCRVVFVAELTRWLDRGGQSWASRGVDFDTGIHEIAAAPIFGMHLAMGPVAHVTLWDASRDGTVIHFADGAQYTPTDADRNALRAQLQNVIERDWAPYVRDALVQQGRAMFGQPRR